ncbi:MAG: hypothetical protein N2652_05130 [Kiritimatiellae bacterium]|nr:hypothetical protein [Kiritimatiellia bacterium]
MSFEQGRISFRIFRWRGELPADWADCVRRHACPPPTTVGAEPAQGWTGGRHPLDLPVVPEHLTHGGWIRMLFVRALRRPPGSYLAATIRAEEAALQAALNRPFLDRRTRAKIRKEVTDRLCRESLPSLSVVQVLADPAEGIAYASALSDTLADRVTVWWQRSFGRRLDPLDPMELARELRSPHPREWPPFAERHIGDSDPGCEFLTWLWFAMEQGESEIDVPGQGRAAYVLEGPLVLGTEEGEGALETVVRRGQPIAGVEARAALRAGKLLRRATLRLASGAREWSCVVDGRSFGFRSFQPADDPELRDPLSRFQDRARQLHEFRRLWVALYRRFLEVRTVGSTWQSVRAELDHWLANG